MTLEIVHKVKYLVERMTPSQCFRAFRSKVCSPEQLLWKSKLHRAINQDNIEQIIRLSSKLEKYQPESNDITLGEHQEPPILIAVEKACENEFSVETIKTMIKLGYRTDVNSKDATLMTPLYAAARSNRPDLLLLLLRAGADPNRYTGRDLSSLFIACASGNIECVRQLLNAGAKPNDVSTSLKTTPLHMASTSGHKDDIAVCRLLLNHGADVNARNSIGRSALDNVCASRRNLAHMVQFLMENGAELNVQSSANMSGVDEARTFKQRN